MKNSSVVLFWSRLLLYFSVPALILVHPGIAVSFDRISFTQWFIIIPLLSFLAFFSPPKFSFKKRCVISGIALLFIAAGAGWFGFGTLQLLLAGVVSFTLTYLLFNFPRWAKISALEPFFLAWVCLRLLGLSRSGEDAARQSMELTQFLFVWTAVIFLLYSFVIYLCLFPKSTDGAVKEGGLFALAALGVFALIMFVLPPDFVRNSMIDNLLPEKIPEKVKETSEYGMPHDAGGGRRQGRRTVPRGENSRGQELRGISEYEWQNKSSDRDRRDKGNKGKRGEGESAGAKRRKSDSSGKGKRGEGENSEGGGEGRGDPKDTNQYMVMIVAADREPVYMGDVFSGHLDPEEGFLPSPQEPLNNLANQRFFTTWFDNEPEVDIGRKRQEVIALSTRPQKYLPYRPVSIDPTILSEDSGPLRYIHQVVSNTPIDYSLSLMFVPSRPFSDFEKDLLAPYMEISLYEDDEKVFREYLNTALANWQENRKELLAEITKQDNIDFEPINEHLEKILALLTSFSTFLYNISYTEDLDIDDIKDFLFDYMEGDCTEFSNTLALLGRLAGIPSRVVTGFLVAEDQQTPAHIRGLYYLRNKIPFLQQFPFNNLFLVTNIAHSWTQFYIPDYGWLDFEATSFAIPPRGFSYSDWDVVIPLIDENKVFSQIRKFPWRAVLRAAGIMAVLALVCAYALRYGREFSLYLGAKRGGRVGARSLYLLLLAKLAADGKPVKPASKTALEYVKLFPRTEMGDANGAAAAAFPHFKNFASLYTEIRWREFNTDFLMNERFLQLKQEYLAILKNTLRPGPLGWLRRGFSLRGLGYL